jgi:hypothetical protein
VPVFEPKCASSLLETADHRKTAKLFPTPISGCATPVFGGEQANRASSRRGPEYQDIPVMPVIEPVSPVVMRTDEAPANSVGSNSEMIQRLMLMDLKERELRTVCSVGLSWCPVRRNVTAN